MQSENIGKYIRQLREKENMPLRKLAAILDIDQSTLSKLERGERPINRQMLPIIAKTFNIDEKELKRQMKQDLQNVLTQIRIKIGYEEFDFQVAQL